MKSSNGLKGLTVVSFESRMALPMERLIEKHGGKPIVAPSMKEVPLEENPKAFQFFEDLKAGKIDLLILMTGVATRTFIKVMETRHPKEEILKILSTKTKIVVRGPKPTKVCKINDIPIAVTAPEPNTWREILTILNEEKMLAGKTIGVLEYGISNTVFLEELENTAATVMPVPVYKWALPDDVGPLHRALDSIIEGNVDLALFTSAIQVDNMLQVARDRRQEAALRRAFAKVGIFSIGPMCSEKLRELQFFPDEEVFPNKMDQIVELAAQKGSEVVERKRKRAERSWVRIEPPPLCKGRPGGVDHGSARDLPPPTPPYKGGEIRDQNRGILSRLLLLIF